MTTLFVSSAGGHLAELHSLVPRLTGVDSDRMWVTFDTPQSRSLLEDENVIYADYTESRDIKSVLRNSVLARRLFRRRHPFSTVISAGSGIALSFLPIGRLRGASCHYIEASARSMGPSVTGRLLGCVPGIALYSQYPSWAKPPWKYAGSVLDAFTPGPPRTDDAAITRAVVMVGTMELYPFRRLIERALKIIPANAEVLWQTGCTDVSDLPIVAHRQLPSRDLQDAIEAADVVIAHAGCGSSLAALEVGKKPVLVPRLRVHGECVDDHQLLIAEQLAKRDLAVARSADELTLADLRLARQSTVRCESGSAPFVLAD
jgi:UDP-N-acetylglucosamine--N-acetylmuramyl-(pentapeptide) pyrophosphoryl-undecaprenol N-acetylglucosamine transferase